MDINTNIPHGWSYFNLQYADSTNEEVKKLLQENHSIPLLLVSKQQGKGRGRLNRKWISLDGNLFFSFATDFSRLSPETISYLVSVSLINSIDKFLFNHKKHIECKWPNDICFQGKKVAGILMEILNNGSIVVIGIGVNLVKTRIENSLYPVGDLSQFSIDRESLMFDFCNEFIKQLALLDNYGFSYIRNIWLSRARGIGSKVIVNLGDNQYSGIFRGVNHKGFLILDQYNGEEKIISTGDVIFSSGV
ncbi:MAG: biotin--[acetyl-CoA-carboxylase] ligase [Pseudomonadota bacterium]|nr:biotin--[acetyl-CoA-carboxylase] ligase [Pseudomonadota bacterium]